MISRFLLSLIFLLSVNVAIAQDHYNEKSFNLEIKPYEQYALVSFELLEPGAKLYWRNPGELGLATKFDFIQSKNLSSAQVFWPFPKISQSQGLDSYIYQNKVDFVIKTFAKNKDKDIILLVDTSFAICNERCDEYDLQLSTIIKKEASANIEEDVILALKKTAKLNGSQNLKILSVRQEKEVDQYLLKVNIESEEELRSPRMFFDLPEYAQFSPSKFILTNEEEGQVITIPFSMDAGKTHLDKIYLNLMSDNGYVVEYESSDIEFDENYSFIWIAFYALLGGLILNVMPCVLPIIALKSLQIAKLSGKDNIEVKKSLIAQSFGIIVSFMMFSVITYGLQQIGRQVGFGFQFQEPIYLITLVVILSFIAIYLIEKVEFNIAVPQILIKLFPVKQRNSREFFLSGVLATLLAIPCTAPFVTVAVGFALTAEFLDMFIIFSLIGIGMASPYLILSIYPSLGKLFPKPGNWMIKFKKILGVIIFATTLWLIYVISTQLGYKAGVTLFLLVVLLKFVLIEKNILHYKVKLISIIMLVSLCYYVPHHLYEEKHKEEVIIEDVWQEYRPELVPQLVKKGYVVLVDITASWCATCKINKFTTLNNTAVMEYMKTHKVISMRADISKINPPQVYALMEKYNHFGIPLNVIYSQKFPKGKVLPSVLLPGKLISLIEIAEK